MTWLSVLALVVAAPLVVGWVLLLGALRQLRRRAHELEAEVAALTPPPALAPDLAAALGAGDHRVIVIEILNPIEVATQRVKAARLLGAMAPEMLRKVVVDEAAKEVVEQLAAEGVAATVRIHAAR
jgi:HAMP domain-containing protein